MSKIDSPRPFLAVNIAILTVSDSRTLDDDRSGQTLVDRLQAAGHVLADRAIVTDDVEAIAAKLEAWIDDAQVDVVIATGGTGVTGRDVTPEAFESIYEKSVPGFGEMFRMLSYEKIKTSTIQSRATAGVAGGTYL
ncbi:MAG TPA: MogA/MoaB family molybdenum cofactor biosynthesis protein, partial [Alphaproteobacteria bacterium]|nr:MogA/MoaB family molybdenum cofactor biosynthesis protein [Alphaproteobacteria bacterium]